MPEAILVALQIAFPALGAVTRRRWSLVLPLAAVPLFYLGLARDWWGYGVGDGWQYAAAVFTVLGVATTALAVVIGRSVRPPR